WRGELDASVSISPDGLTVAVAYTQRYSSTDLDVMATRLNVQLVQPGLTLWEGSPTMRVDRTFRVGSQTNKDEFDPSVIVTNNGNFVVAYSFAATTRDID